MSLTSKLDCWFDSHPYRNAVNRYLANPPGGGNRPVYWDIDQACPELRLLEKSHARIRAEVDALLEAQKDIPLP